MTTTLPNAINASDPFLEKLAGMLKEIDICMLTTHAGSARFSSRPMALQAVEFDGDLWFFCCKNSRLAREIAIDPNVSVTASNPSKAMCVSLNGQARTVSDPARMKDLWKPSYIIWFPKGLEDPDLTLLHVNVREAEYWEWASGLVSGVVQLLKSLTGKSDDDLGQHERRQI